MRVVMMVVFVLAFCMGALRALTDELNWPEAITCVSLMWASLVGMMYVAGIW